MKEQHGPTFPPMTRRRSATQEDLETRRTDDYPPASPHRIGHTPGLHGEDAPYQSQEIIQPGLRTIRGNGYMNGTAPAHQRLMIEDEEEQDDYADAPKKRPSTARRVDKNPLETRVLPQRRIHFHWLVFVGLGLFIMIVGWVSFSALSSWWGVQQDDWQYGRPRTYQTDAVVGHGDSAEHPSHFLAMNLHGKVIVIEMPGGDPSHAQVYLGPPLFGTGEDLAPVTVSFEDCSGDGKPDLNIHIQGSDKIICFVNNGKTFTTQQQQL